MSRLQMLLDAPVNSLPVQRSYPEFLDRPQAAPQLDFPHRLFAPRHYEPRYEYPLIVWLHSDHSSEWEIDSVMESLSDRNYVTIAPRAMKRSRHSDRLFRWGASTTDLALADEMVWECVQETVQSMSINPSKIFLAGFGTGGTIAQWIALKNPSQFAGVVSINGAFPTARRALADWKRAKSLPSLFIQRHNSTLCSNDQWDEAIKLAHSAGLNYRFWRLHAQDEFASDADCLDTSMLQAANRFMMSIVTNTPLSLEPETESTLRPIVFGRN